jgi:colanic acid/amylovoran biosynthesis glycosyltransferase
VRHPRSLTTFKCTRISWPPGRSVILYIVDDYNSLSQTFVRREIDSLRERGAPIGVFSLHPTRRASWDWELDPASRSRLVRAGLALALSHRGRALAWEIAALMRAGPWRRVAGQIYALLVAAHVRRVAGTKPAHVHAHFFGRCADIAHYLSRLTGQPYSVTGHATEVLAPDDPVILRRNVASAAGLVGESDLIRGRLTAIDGHSGKPAITIRSGLPKAALCHNSPPAVERAHKGDRPIRLVTTARLVPKKGLWTVVEAARELQTRDVPFRWEILGDGPLRDALDRAIREAAMVMTVHLLGARSNQDVLGYLRRADVFVLPCVRLANGETDGLPAALIEAVALGTPSITTAVGAIPELVVDEHTGLLVPERDPRAVAEAVIKLQHDRDLYVTIAREGQAVARSQYLLENEVRRLHQFFTDCGK